MWAGGTVYFLTAGRSPAESPSPLPAAAAWLTVVAVPLGLMAAFFDRRRL